SMQVAEQDPHVLAGGILFEERFGYRRCALGLAEPAFVLARRLQQDIRRLVAVERFRDMLEQPDVSLHRSHASGFATHGGTRPDVCRPRARRYGLTCLRLAG